MGQPLNFSDTVYALRGFPPLHKPIPFFTRGTHFVNSHGLGSHLTCLENFPALFKEARNILIINNNKNYMMMRAAELLPAELFAILISHIQCAVLNLCPSR